jgi:hypothetical protein
MWKMLVSAASARARRHSSLVQVMAATLREVVLGFMVVLITAIPMVSPTTTLQLVLHPLVGTLILHADQALNLRCTKLPAVLA